MNNKGMQQKETEYHTKFFAYTISVHLFFYQRKLPEKYGFRGCLTQANIYFSLSVCNDMKFL